MKEPIKLIGLKDQPIEDREQESLGLDEYAEVLTEFIKGCDTPLTIALQGDWGSGKTSLMRLIRNEILSDESCHTVWFNTWQYSQFNMEDTLALSMMSKISEDLAPDTGSDGFKSLKRSLWTATRAIAIGGASVIGQADTAKEIAEQLKRTGDSAGHEDPTKALEQIKDGLSKIVKERTEGTTHKVVIFIDDLDRLVPKRAVELLEAMKIFLDIDGCVYVIACDYSVVAAGLEDKFGTSVGQLKGKSFFDKIIQVPFKMPTRRYQVNDYIKTLLEQINVEHEEDDIEKYCELVEYSVGFNPRTMKRLLNTLQLLTILENKRRQRESTTSTQSEDRTVKRSLSNVVTFAVLCMLEKYEAIYDYITEEQISSDRFNSLLSGLKEGEDFAGIRQQVAGMANESDDTKIDPMSVKNALDFVITFVSCLQIDDDNELSDEELRHLEEIISLTALVSTRQLQDFRPREFAKDLKKELNNRYRSFYSGQEPKYEKFRMYDGTVFLDLSIFPDSDAKLQIGMDGSQYYFDARSDGIDYAWKLGREITQKLNWDEGEELRDYYFEIEDEEDEEMDDEDFEYIYRFFVQSATEKLALDKYRDNLCKRLDELTEPRALIYDLCRKAHRS